MKFAKEKHPLKKFGSCPNSTTHLIRGHKRSSMEEETKNWDEEETLSIMTSAAPKNAECSACGRTSSESGEALYYSYSNGNKMIHRKCAHLPKQIDHPMHPEHPLVLLAKPPYESERFRCRVCKREFLWNFVYHCSLCEFDVDILCAFLEDKDIMIPTHHHPVRLIPRPASFICNACDDTGRDDESYICTKPSCGFWVHKECGSLPEMFKRPDHDHPLQVAISMPARYREYKFTCEVCRQDLGSEVWIYYCQQCKYFYHIKCIAFEAPSQRTNDDSDDAYPLRWIFIRELKTVVKHTLRTSNIVENALHNYVEQQGRGVPEVKVDSHKHSLVLNSDHHQHEDEDEIICDGCIEPIDHASSPYYKCGQHCNFFLHTTCATLPKHRKVGAHRHHEDTPFTELKLYFPKNPWEVVKCKACNSFCNGYAYKCTKTGCNFSVDIKCCYLIGYITHIGHKHHLFSSVYYHFVNKFMCSGCGCQDVSAQLHCDPCRFSLGYCCATLPATVKHRWDKHPLILSFPPHLRDTDTDGDEEFYCEVCEEEIHPKHWMYRCAECDHSFHPRCIPTLGESRNIKFGKTCSIKRHPHCLTMVPQAKLTSMCHTCGKSLYWSRAFECAPCGFYLCPDCLPKEELLVVE